MDLDSYSQTLTKPRGMRPLVRLHELLRFFSPSERLILYGLSVLLAIGAFGLLVGANAAVSVEVPSSGGSYTEGLIGPARFINPVLTISGADEDLTALVYSGLTRVGEGGAIVPDLAEGYEIAEDGLTYTFTLREGLTFHDGAPLTSADILFTVHAAQNPDIRSPHRADWDGVQVSAPDARTVIFKLPRPYAPFLQNTTLGILPEHRWRDVKPSEFAFSPLNTKPVGSGPYKVVNSAVDASGAATVYELAAFKDFALHAPYVKRITFRFYPNEDALVRALNAHEVDAVAGVNHENIAAITRDDVSIMTTPLPRVFGIFFNQNHAPVFTDLSARRALSAAIDKNRLVSQILGGYGAPLDGPIPPGILSGSALPGPASTTRVSTAYTQETLDAARAMLENGGWKWSDESGTWTKGSNTLTFALSTVDSPELVATADAVATAWRQLGVDVTVQVYPLSELNTTVIRPRSYDALLFGEVVGRELDLFAFWHSSQRNDPGLNLAGYTNSRVDSLLAEARATTDREAREQLYREFATLVAEEHPAVFLFSPQFIYVVPEGLRGISLGSLTTPAERFARAHEWYTDTERVWSIFLREDQKTLLSE